MLTLLLLALLSPAATTWTVNAAGGADFTQISEAIDSVAAGDVLLVEPGTYGGFDLSKRLTIIGRAGGVRPRVTGDVRLVAASFTLAGFDLDRLRVTGVVGRGRIDDCRVAVLKDANLPYVVEVDGCAELVISRMEANGSKAWSQSHPNAGGSPMRIRTSCVTLVDCKLTGAKGFDAAPGDNHGGIGGTGLGVFDASSVVIVGSTIRGGFEGYANCVFTCICDDGAGGSGVEVFDSFLVVRGAGDDVLGGGDADHLCGQTYGNDVWATNSTVIVSGVVTLYGVHLSNTTYLLPVTPEPFVEIGGSDVPGRVRTVRLSGPAGATALVAASLAPASLTLGKLEGKLWFAPDALVALVPVVMQGQNLPVLLDVSLPAATAGLEGLAIEVQPVFPTIPGALDPGKQLGGNVAELIVRF